MKAERESMLRVWIAMEQKIVLFHAVSDYRRIDFQNYNQFLSYSRI